MADIIEKDQLEIEEKVVQIDRVTRVVKGGRRLRFRAIVVVGDKQGKVGVGVEKSTEVIGAIEKATTKAKRYMKTIALKGTTIPHEVVAEFAGAKVFLKPARKGTGVIAGGAVRAVLDAAGVKDVLSKIQGSSSKLNNVYAAMKALEMLSLYEEKEKNQQTVLRKK
jgi:small subunit ribosomal protein S5